MKATQLISKLEKTKKNKDARRVFINFSYLSILQIGGYVLPIITYPYLARVIGVTGFGKIAFAMSVIVYFTTIIDWGYNLTATRDVAINRDNKDQISRIYSVVMTSKLFLLAASFALLLFLLFSVPLLQEHADIIAIAFLIVIGQTLFPEWLFQGLENMRVIVILNMSSKILFTLLIFAFIHSPNDYILQPLFAGLGYIVAGIVSLVYVRKKFNIKFHLCTIEEVKESIKNSFDVFLNNLMPNLYTSFSVLLLGQFGGSVANGILDGANKFYSICAQFLSVLSRAFFPFLSRRIDKHSAFLKIKLGITILFSIFIILGADILIRLFLGESFKESALLLRIFGVSLIFHSLTNIYGTNYLIIIGEEKILRKITMVVSIIGFLIAFPLIFFFGFIGAACTITIARIMLGVVVYYTAKKKMRLRKNIISL